MGAGAKKYTWLDRHLISDKDHAADLDQRAAELEFLERLPRSQAETRAYQEYRKRQSMVGAAHHLRGLRAAQASGDREDARKHSALLDLHAKSAGFNPYEEVPAELNQYLRAESPEPIHRFRAHKADMLALDTYKKGDQ